MAQPDKLDFDQTHRYFSTSCFNNAWELLDRQDRTPDDDQQMLLLAFASLWHWTQRPDCTDKHLSIGYWQISRIYSVLKDAENARKYAQLCLNKTPADDPFCLGYAHEALARAESIAGNVKIARQHFAEALKHADSVSQTEDQKLLLDDLQQLERVLMPA
ncbi:MAG: hypothetical protein KDA86_02105 [Planctomycetaceae bacterium]|nr:hypothetical protein [Planctomycetaceae bacterium]